MLRFVSYVCAGLFLLIALVFCAGRFLMIVPVCFFCLRGYPLDIILKDMEKIDLDVVRKIVEDEAGERVSWCADLGFYASCGRNGSEGGHGIYWSAALFLSGVRFYVYGKAGGERPGDIPEEHPGEVASGQALKLDSFSAMDVYYSYNVLRADVLSFFDGMNGKKTTINDAGKGCAAPASPIRRAAPLFSTGKQTLFCIEGDGGLQRFLDLKGKALREFKELFSIAQAKQKYSREANGL